MRRRIADESQTIRRREYRQRKPRRIRRLRFGEVRTMSLIEFRHYSFRALVEPERPQDTRHVCQRLHKKQATTRHGPCNSHREHRAPRQRLPLQAKH